MKVARLTGLEPATPGVTGRYSNQLSYNRTFIADLSQRLPSGTVLILLRGPSGRATVARLTGLEPATPGVTGRYSNQLSYNRTFIADLSQRLPSGTVLILLRGPSGRATVARLTGLEPATPGVTGRYSNQLSYNRLLLRPTPWLNVGV